MRRVILGVLAVALLALLAAGGVVGWYLATPASTSKDVVTVEVPRGAGLATIAADLEAAGVIRNERAFRVYVRAVGKQGAVQAGEYALNKDMTPPQVLDKLLSGETVQYRITIPEGYNARQIVRVIADSGLGDETVLSQLVEDEAFTRSLGVPADRLEGYLFPDTYEFDKLAGEKRILSAMVDRWKQTFTPEWEARARDLNMSVHEVMTLASIIEKETAQKDERARIGGVFHNRLARDMKLETDPTVIYGIQDYDGDIRFRDLRNTKNPYNTYVIKGLPPGPIASPGRAAIEAALWPEQHDYLFFVSRNDGTHVFSKTFAEHNRWVQQYQRRRRKRGG